MERIVKITIPTEPVKISVGGRYRSPNAEQLAELEIEYERGGMLAVWEYHEKHLIASDNPKVGCATYVGTSGDVEKAKEAKARFSAENDTEI